MTLDVAALVLFAALLHALWNALIKASTDTVRDTACVMAGACVIAAPLLPFLPLPAPPSWPYLLASCLLHQVYFALLTAAYRSGELSLAYPLMRGVAPLIVAFATLVLLPQPPAGALWLGVAAISAGVLWIGGVHRAALRMHAHAIGFALTNAVFIASYTVVDGLGVRAAGNAASYGLWLFFLIAWPYLGVLLWIRRGRLRRPSRALLWRGLVGGAASVAAYLIALWAMTRAPIAAVAALRETSVIFAALIGAWLLKEPLGRQRIAGACLVALGIALLKV
jgi:drug/metabolite transporter (DMT)-like permease